jgi:hypothetical protein
LDRIGSGGILSRFESQRFLPLLRRIRELHTRGRGRATD